MARRRGYRRRKGKRRGSRRVPYKTKRYVKQQINRNIETKQFEVYGVEHPASVTGARVCLTAGIVRGTDFVNRIGTTIVPKHLRVRWSAQAADPFNRMRILIFQFFEPIDPSVTSNFPSMSEILPGITGTTDAAQNMLIPTAWQNRHQFKVLYDKSFYVQGSPGGFIRFGGKKTRKLRKINWTGLDILSGVEASGHIFMYMLSDSAATGHPPVYYVSRLLFKDA